MEGQRKKRIADLLNQSRAANIPQSEEIANFITDYFAEDADPSDDDLSEDDEEFQSVQSLLPHHRDHGMQDQDEDEVDDHEEEDEKSDGSNQLECEEDNPFVHVDQTIISSDGDCVNLNYPAQQQAVAFACKCKQIKVAAEEGISPHQRRGCIAQFTSDEVVTFQLNTSDMDKDGLDMFIMGIFSANMHNTPTTQSSRKKSQKERQRTRTEYCLLGRIVCKKTFFFMTGVGDKRLRNIMTHFKAEGPCQRQDKRGGRKNNTKALSLEETNNVYCFIKNYAEDCGVNLPGRVPGFHRSDILLLPSSSPKSKVYREYLASAETAGYRPVSMTTFRGIWLSLLPFIVVSRPMTDLCWVCQKNMHRIYRSANLNDEEKQELLFAQQAHLSRVEEERRMYKMMVEDCKRIVMDHGIQELGETPPCTRDISIHYSFDFAQQIHLPHSPYQPGPMYFLTPRKVGIFGVCCEGLPQQINYLVDEGASAGKGSNAVVSYLHHFFLNYGLGEVSCDLHCDNCAGQNKNRYMLWYCAWRIMTGKHRMISLNFMPPGHTKFAPDWCFGLLKQAFRKAEVHCLDDLCNVVEDSTPVKHVNRAQIVKKEEETATSEVVSYNWQIFFQNHFRNLQGIKKIGHFRFTAERPGYILYRETLADEEVEFKLVTDVAKALTELPDLPPIIPAPGLSRERQAYLYNNIRPFVRDGARDILTPNLVPDHN